MAKSTMILGAVCLALAGTVAVQWIELRRTPPAVNREAATSPGGSEEISTLIEEIRPPDRAPALGPQAAQAATPPGTVEVAPEMEPAFRAAMIDYQAISLRQQYAPIIASLRLSPEQADRFIRVLAEEWGSVVARRVPSDYTGQSWAGGQDEQLREVLTQAQIDAFHHYQQTTETRQQVEQLRNELMASSEPLRDAQIAPLVDLLHAEEMRLFTEVRDQNPAGGEAIETEESRLETQEFFQEREGAAIDRELAAARAILSGEQLRALKRQLEARRSLGLAGSKVIQLDRERQRSEAASDPGR